MLSPLIGLERPLVVPNFNFHAPCFCSVIYPLKRQHVFNQPRPSSWAQRPQHSNVHPSSNDMASALLSQLTLSGGETKIPALIYGTAWKKERTKELVVQAIQSGFVGVDTAAQPKHYREDLVGDALRLVLLEGTLRRPDVYVRRQIVKRKCLTWRLMIPRHVKPAANKIYFRRGARQKRYAVRPISSDS